MTAEETVYNLIKDLCDGRVTPLMGVQGESFPYITYQRISTNPINLLTGDSGSGFVRIQIDIVADELTQITLLAKEIRKRLKDQATYLNERDDPDEESSVYRKIQDYNVFEKGI